jgi:hypothetical protein
MYNHGMQIGKVAKHNMVFIMINMTDSLALKLLSENISSASSLDTSMRSKGWFS